MNTFININKSYDPNLNFWELNPHLIYVKPYSTLYSNDESKSKKESSNIMWCVLWMIDPNENTNKYFRLPEDQRLEVCKTFYEKFDEKDELVKEIMSRYPEDCLTIIQRVLRNTKEFLRNRDNYIKTTEYNLDTMAALDNAAAKTVKIVEDFAKIEKQFDAEESKTRILGGRQQTARERGDIKAN